MNRRKICVVTGSRAEYGLLYWLIKGIQEDPDIVLQIIVTGSHLSAEFGLTYKMIEQDGFTIDEKVEMILSSDTAVGIAKSIGLGVIGFADTLNRLQPDILVLLGDRYEIFAAAQAALVARIPIAHIAGGDTTEGAFDEAFRHSITKMSHLHFATNEAARKRIIQMGENPDFVFNVGSPGIDYIKHAKLISREEIERILLFTFRGKNILVTFHPVTLDSQPSTEQLQFLFQALDRLREDVGIIFTLPNADNESREIMRMIENYVTSRKYARAYTSLGQSLYLSLIAQVDAVIGNSSSGLYEVPSFKKPTVNIGDRQKGRLQAASVINCAPNAGEIFDAINKAFEKDCTNVINPYGEGDSSIKILYQLKSIENPKKLIMKHFFNMEF